jgi:RNA polymerase sigma-70 factor (ECF subfamily)
MEPLAQSSLRLIERARAGDAAALNELVRRYLPRLRVWARGRLPTRARDLIDTEDIVQETMVKAIRNFDRVDVSGDGALQAYLRQAVTNKLADAYRGTQRRPSDTALTSDIPAAEPSPLEQAIGNEAVARYEQALARLKPSDREAVVLRIELWYDYQEIADMLGKSSAAAARVAVSRALARLSREMGSHV